MTKINKSTNTYLQVVMICITLLLIMLTVFSVYYANRMVSKYSNLVATSIEVKLEITSAHLWFEEIISGDKNESINTVWAHINQAENHLKHILKERDNSIIGLIPDNTPNLEVKTLDANENLVLFKRITHERFSSIEDSGVGSQLDQKYDAVYHALLNDINNIISDLKSLRKHDLDTFNSIQKLLIVILLASGISVGFILYFYQKRLLISIDKQYKINLELNENKTRFQDIALCGGDWIWEVDSQGTYTYASENVIEILGYSSSEIIGRTPFDLMPEEEREIISSKFIQIVKNQDKIIDLDNWSTHKNGKTVYLRTNGVPIFDAEGILTGYRGVDKDITEYKAMNDLLLRTQKMDALGKLTGGIAHDFNNLLGVILGYAELLKSSLSKSEKDEKYTQQIIKAGQRSKNLVEKLLLFSKNNPLSGEKTCINQLLKDDQLMLEKTLTARIGLIYNLSSELWPVYLNKSSLEDSILNISINAMHAISGNGTFTITTSNIHLSSEDTKKLDIPAGDYVALTMTDNGSGMDDSTLQKIFDPYFTTKGSEGVGLGLSQLYGFIQLSDGGINVTSQVGKGSTFILYLPRYTGKDTILQEQQNVGQNLYGTGKETILIVDDEESLRELAHEILTSNNYKVLVASSAQQAVEILEAEKVNLLLSDIIMPEMNGYELASIVRERYPKIKIQMVSGFSDVYNDKNIDETLHSNRLAKPYNVNELLQRIRLLLD